jgi:hypothetical protein
MDRSFQVQRTPFSGQLCPRTLKPAHTQHSPIMPWLSSATTSTGCTLHLFLSALMNHRNRCRPSRHLAASSIILCTCQIVLRLVVTTWQANQLHSRGPCAPCLSIKPNSTELEASKSRGPLLSHTTSSRFKSLESIHTHIQHSASMTDICQRSIVPLVSWGKLTLFSLLQLCLMLACYNILH